MPNVHRVCIVIVVLAMICGWSAGFECAQTESSLEHGHTQALAAWGELVAIDAGHTVLLIDLSTPTTPVVLSQLHPEGYRLSSLAWADGFLLLGGDTLEVIEVADPSRPITRGSVDLPGVATGLAVEGSTVFAAAYTKGLHAFDISDPDAPVKLGHLQTPGSVHDVAIQDNLAYVADGNHGLTIVDVSDPAHMAVVGRLDLPNAWRVAAAGTLAFVSDGLARLHVVDVTSPGSPSLLSSICFDSSARVNALLADHDHVWVGLAHCYDCPRASALAVVDISAPAAPTVAAHLDLFSGEQGAGGVQALARIGNHLAVADLNMGLRVIDVAIPSEPAVSALVNVTFDEVFDVAVQSDLAFVADRGLRVIDLSSSAGPALVAQVEDLGPTVAVAVDGQHAVVLDSNGVMTLFDVSNPIEPTNVGRYDTEVAGHAIALDGTLVAVGSDDGLRLLDTAPPGDPRLLSTIPSPGPVRAVVFDGSYVHFGNQIGSFSAGTGTLVTVDVSTPANPCPIGSLTTPLPVEDINLVGTTAVILEGGFSEATLRVVDLSDPEHPMTVGSCSLANRHPSGLIVSDDLAYVVHRPGMLSVVDLGWRSHPTEGSPNIWQPFTIADGGPQGGFGVAMHGDRVVVADGEYGLRIVSVSQCQSGPVTLPGGGPTS
jgi:hypothetical protein